MADTKQIKIKADIHADLKKYCKENGYKIEFLTGVIISEYLKSKK